LLASSAVAGPPTAAAAAQQRPAARRRPRTVIQATDGWRALHLGDLWRSHEIVYFLAWRDVKVRYKQTVLGVVWAVLQPLVGMAVFTVLFGRLARLPSDGVPYWLFAYVGLLPWLYFANAVTKLSVSIVANTDLISKVYFPRLAIPLAGVAIGLIDLAVGLVLLAALLLFHGATPVIGVLLLPVLVAFATVAALSVGLWLAALDVHYRDIRHVIPFLLQVWMFATPVVYPTTLVPERYRVFYGLNPMVGVVDGFRWALLGNTPLPIASIGVSGAAVALLLVTGLFYFRRMERTFADVI
jgi:lipopolysaccharide transport system permease protein